LKILVTGAAGFIGSHLVESCLDDQHYVIGLDNLSSGSNWNINHLLDNRSFKFVKGDIRDRGLLSALTKDVDILYHLAAQVHVDKSYIDPLETYEVNVQGTQNVLETARLNDVSHIVYASSSEVYGSNVADCPMAEEHPLRAPHPYGASKIAADRMCYAYAQTYGMNISIMRSFNVFGPRQREVGYGGVISIFLRRILSNFPPIIFGDGTQTRDYTYVSDTIQAYRTVASYAVVDMSSRTACLPINFGTGVGVSVKDIALKLIELTSKELEPVHVDARPGEVQNLLADYTKATALYGWQPEINFNDGLKRYVDWYMKYGNR